MVVAADNLIDNVLPIAADILIKKPAIIQRLRGWEVGCAIGAVALYCALALKQIEEKKLVGILKGLL